MDRHRHRADAVLRSVLESPGTVDPKVREAASRNQDVPPALAAYVDKVAKHAYKITDDEVAALKKAGYTDDQLFELTIAAAVGQALRRLDAGLAHLKQPEKAGDNKEVA